MTLDTKGLIGLAVGAAVLFGMIYLGSKAWKAGQA